MLFLKPSSVNHSTKNLNYYTFNAPNYYKINKIILKFSNLQKDKIKQFRKHNISHALIPL